MHCVYQVMVNENQLIPYDASELPVNKGPWLVFAPHADDESFGMGGTIVKAVSAGIAVHVVIMTDGALGGGSADLVQVRRQEATRAAELLGTQPPVFLDYPDRGLKVDDTSIERVREQIKPISPAVVFFPGCFELHPDHRATAALVWRALRGIQDSEIIPVSYEVLVQSPVNVLVDISACMEKKKAAMSVYASQLSENRYIDIATSLNQLRSLTLCGDISHAEAFYCFDPADVREDFDQVILTKLGVYFRV